MKISFLNIVFALFSGFSAVAQGQLSVSAVPVADSTNNMATVYVYRPSDGMARAYSIVINDGKRVKLNSGEVYRVKIPAGSAIITVAFPLCTTFDYNFKAQAGANYYFRPSNRPVMPTDAPIGIGNNFSAVELLDVPERTFKKEFTTGKLKSSN